MRTNITLFLGLLCASATTLSAQQPIDSLQGFDAAAATRAAISERYTSEEMPMRLAQLKRRYINDKFGLASHSEPMPWTASRSMTANCVNEDFESTTQSTITTSTTVQGWLVTGGMNYGGTNNSCNMLGCCPSSPTEAVVMLAPNGYTDPVIGNVYPLYSVFGSTPGNTMGPTYNPQITSGMFGDNFIRINSSMNNFSMERLTKNLTVTSSNALFKFAFVSVLYPGHGCCDAGAFMIKVTDVTTNSVLSSWSYSAMGMSSSCVNSVGVVYYDAGTGAVSTPTTYNTIFNKWHVNYIDLSPYMGDNIQIEVTATDCTAGGHYAYVYFDAECGPLDIQVNSLNKPLSCESTATVSAPSNLNAYQWSGPGGFTSTLSAFTTTVAGVYSLTIPQNPPYQALAKTLSLVISPASVSVTASNTLVCKGDKVTIGASGLTTYSWSTGSTAPGITVTPQSNTGYTVSGVNSDNCQGLAVVNISMKVCTSLDEHSNTDLVMVYPNPNNGEFTVMMRTPTTSATLQVFDQLGKLVYTAKMEPGANNVRMVGMPKGLYYFTLREGSEKLASGKVRID